MNTYLLFNGNNDTFGDGDDLSEHLRKLRRYGGTPDCYDTVNGCSVAYVQDSLEVFPTIIVDESNHKIVKNVRL